MTTTIQGSRSVDEALAKEMSGRDKLAALLEVRFGGVAAWARLHGWHREHVHFVLSGARVGEDVRAALARDLKVSREEIDWTIESGRTALGLPPAEEK